MSFGSVIKRVIENKVSYVINLHYLLEHLVVIYGQQTTYKMVKMGSYTGFRWHIYRFICVLVHEHSFSRVISMTQTAIRKQCSVSDTIQMQNSIVYLSILVCVSTINMAGTELVC